MKWRMPVPGLIACTCAGAMGGLVASMGFGLSTWEWWAVLLLMVVYGIARYDESPRDISRG